MNLTYLCYSQECNFCFSMCEVSINDKLLSIGQQHTKHKKKCKNLAIRLGLKTLAKSCYTVEVSVSVCGDIAILGLICKLFLSGLLSSSYICRAVT